jgi:NAD dependent epimerase/dehydratase family enzyme
MSWISLADLTRAFIAAIEREDLSGTCNAVAPNPVTNNEFMGELRRVLQRPWCPPAPEWAVHIGAKLLKMEPSLALTGCRCAPKRLLASGFTFQYPDLLSALRKLYE